MRTPDPDSLIVARSAVFEARSDWAAPLGESGCQSFSTMC